jgi:hypothetical protein
MFVIQCWKSEINGLVMKKFVLSAMMLAGCAAAQADTGYIGLGYGMTSFKIDCASYTPCDKNDSGAKAYIGLNVAPGAAVELGYLSFGRAQLGTGRQELDVKSQAFVANVALRHAFIPEFSGLLRLGISSTKTSLLTTEDGSRESQTISKPYWGFGLEYQFNKSFKAVAAADFLKGRVADYKGDGEMYSLSAQVGF